MEPDHSPSAAQLGMFEKAILAVVAALVAVGVSGLWVMTGTMARLEERVGIWTTLFEKRFERMDMDLKTVERKIDAVEASRTKDGHRIDALEYYQKLRLERERATSMEPSKRGVMP